jgi:hypothetical protein
MAQTERGSAPQTDFSSETPFWRSPCARQSALEKFRNCGWETAAPLGELDHRLLGDLAMYRGPVSGRESRYFISERSAAAVRSLRFIHHFAVNCTVWIGQPSLTAGDIASSAVEGSMLAVFGRRKRMFGVLAWALFAAVASAPARADTDTVVVHVDQAQLLKLPDRIATVVIGNPLIADATLQSGGILIVTGKGYGTTNLMALDRNGRVIMNKSVRVLGPSDIDLVVVYNGSERETYSCAPQCQPRIALGDSIHNPAGYFPDQQKNFYNRNVAVTSDRNKLVNSR